jgi:hypothetical protein
VSVVLGDQIEGGAYRLSPHLLRHIQWNVCEQGTVMRPVTAESIRSRQTGHVGSSYTAPDTDPRRANADETESSVSIMTDETETT